MTRKTFPVCALALAAALAVPAGAQAQPLPTASPESVGLSAERLRRIDDFFASEMERNRVPGAVVAIARQGKLVYFKAFGFADKSKGLPMATDTLFQLASMTKPMVAVGALALTEQGRQESVALGERFRANKVQVDLVLSSQWCRCLDTARLAFGKAEPFAALNNVFGNSSREPAQNAETRKRIRDWKGPGTLSWSRTARSSAP